MRRRAAALAPAVAAGVRLRAAALALAVAVLAGCGAPAPQPSGAGPTVVAFGDSVPAGTACGCVPFPVLYARMLAPDGRAVNLARPGYTSADVRAQIITPTAESAVRAADVLLVMVGANDITGALQADRGEAAYAEVAGQVGRDVTDVVATLRAVREDAVPVLVIGYWNVAEDGEVGRADYGAGGLAAAVSATMHIDDALRGAAAASGADYVDTSTAFKGETGAEDPTGLLAPDGDHPNAAGHEAIARAAYAVFPTGRRGA